MKGFFDEVRSGMREMDWIGGELVLARVRGVGAKLELACCPFCGSPAALRGVFMYETPAVIVECPDCHCKTPPFGPQFDYRTGKNELFGPECVKKAAARWNQRAEATA